MPTEIKERKIILAEGADAYYFSIWAYQAFGVVGIQVLDFGGIDNLLPYLSTLKELSGFKQVESMVIARDAEQNADAAVKRIKTSLKKTGLPVPDKAFEFSNTSPRVAYIIFPGFLKKGSLADGSLEDLCLEIVKDVSIMNCVDQFIDCLASQSKKPKYPHKTKLHAYLAGKDDFVGLKVGEAAKAGAWDWNHRKMAPFRTIIMHM